MQNAKSGRTPSATLAQDGMLAGETLDRDQRRAAMRQEGLARHAAHNDALHLQGAIRRWGGLQIDMFPS